MADYRLNKIGICVLNNVKMKNKVLTFHNFVVNALHAGSVCPSLENPLSMANLPIPLF